MRRILELPFAYDFVQDILGANRARKRLLATHVSRDVRSVMEIGCGTGRNYEHLVGVDYIGIEPNARYFEAARRRYPDVMFLNRSVEALSADIQVDLLLCCAVLHHLSDCQIAALCRVARQCARSLLAIEPAWDLCGWRWPLLAMDRGGYMRSIGEYEALLGKHLRLDEVHIYEGGCVLVSTL